MKIAILITGEYRTFDHARKSMKFLDQPNIDVYFSTWNETTTVDQFNRQFDKITVNRSITTAIIRDTLGIPATIGIYKPEENRVIGSAPVIESWRLGFNLIKNSNKKYDYVLVLRPDLYFSHGLFNFDTLSNIDYSKYFAVTTLPCVEIQPLGLDDHCFFTTYENMSKILSIESLTEFARDSEKNEWHSSWYRHITEKFGLQIIHSPIMGNQLMSFIYKFSCLDAVEFDNPMMTPEAYFDINRIEAMANLAFDKKLFIFNLEEVLIDDNDLDFNSLINNLEEKNIELFLSNKDLMDKGLIMFFKEIKKTGSDIAIVSNCIRKDIKIILEKLGVIAHVDFYISNKDMECSKPYSDIFCNCMTELNILPEKTIIVEHSLVGLQAARETGAHVIHVQNRKHMPAAVADFLHKNFKIK